LLEDPDGVLWIGTWNGLFRLHGGRRRRFTADDGLPDNNVHRLFRDSRGTVWVATQTGVASATDEGERFTAQALPAGSAKRALVLFEAPTGTLWLGSGDGLARVAGGRGALVTTAEGLPENWTGAIEAEGNEHLLLGQLGGLARVGLDDLIAVADGRRTALTTVATHQLLDALPGGDPIAVPHPWSFRDPSGKLWFAVSRGIIVVDPTRAAPSIPPPAMHVEEVLVDGVRVGAPPGLTLGPAVRRLEVRYTGVDLTYGPAVRFRHRLDGFDTAWTDAAGQRVVSYTRLGAGRYRFRVTGRTGTGAWSPAEATLDVLVLPPLYLRGWFLVLGALAFALLLWGIHRTVLHVRVDAITRERARLAREIHDSLLQGFGGIALQLHAASARLALSPAQQPVLGRILSLIDRTLTDARDVVWEIRLQGTRERDLLAACEDAARRIFADTATAVQVRSRGRRRWLLPEIRAESLRVIEEALTNARKHAAAVNVSVEIEYRWNRLRLTARDDGRGFDIREGGSLAGHWGLLGMRERATRIGGVLAVTSRPGAGTTVSLVVPLWRSVLRGLLRRED
jgi:signal transduction histidine kinase